ncbi:hypothetical protein VRK_19290 [Vibrio sp. MEBiC08052]|nr:hypothetical protein VRK_19290 [Vibrio sp. MEBiC08052]
MRGCFYAYIKRGSNPEESPHNFYPHQTVKGIRAPCFVI